MVRFRSHEVHDGHGTSAMGVDDSGGSFLVPMPSADLKDQIIMQKDLQGAGTGPDYSSGQNGKLPEVDSSAVKLPERTEVGAVEQKQPGSFTRGRSKKKMDPDGVEQQAESFTKHLEGYLPKFHWGNQQQAASKSQRRIYSMCLNLRDVGANMPALMKAGIVFRSSELLSADDMRRYGVRTILDLRRMDRPCKKKGKKIDQLRTVARAARKGPKRFWAERLKPYAARGQPHACSLCRERIHEKIGFEARSVVHADLIPTAVGIQLFRAMPASVKGKAILAALTGKGAASVMAPAVANPLYMGYRTLYKTVLESSKRGIAKAMRVFADKDNYPVLLHCIHGKDRTGIIVMLLLMLCGVESSIIVDDYMKSETVLKASRMHDELDFDVYLTSDAVIAATKDTMEDTILYIDDKYGGAASYLHEAGLEDWELSKIRVNLLQRADASDLLERLSMLQPLPSLQQSIDRRKLQGLFTRSSAQKAGMQRTRSQPESDDLSQDKPGQGGRSGPAVRKLPAALKNTASAPPISRRETPLLHPSLQAAKAALAGREAKMLDRKSPSYPAALAEAGRSDKEADVGESVENKKAEGMANGWAQIISAASPRDINTDELDKPAAAAAHDPNSIAAVPKTPEILHKQSNVSLAELSTDLAPEQKLDTAYQAGATKADSPDTHDSHADTALVNSKSLSPNGRSPAREDAGPAGLQPKAGGPADAGSGTNASQYPAAHADVTTREA